MVLKVMSGDALTVAVKAFYRNNGGNPHPGSNTAQEIVTGIITNLLGGAGTVVNNGHGNLLTGGGGAIVPFTDLQNLTGNNQNNNPSTSTPKAYLNWVLFNEQLEAQSSGFKRVSNVQDVQQVLSDGITVNKNGYLYVWINNESHTDVYFDELSVQHQSGALLQENAYYPYGLPIEPLSSYAAIKTANTALYQSKLLEEELGLNWYYFDARYYDAQIGRFASMDPAMQFANGYNGMGGNPVIGTDPDGRFAIVPLLILAGKAAFTAAAISAATYTVSTALSSGGLNNWSLQGLGNAALSGAISGVLSFGVGQVFGEIGKLGHELLRAGSHGLLQGGYSSLSGGDFWSSFAGTALGSLTGSTLRNSSGFMQVLGSATVGGITSEIGGGDFWNGFKQGGIVALTNHLMHQGDGGRKNKGEGKGNKLRGGSQSDRDGDMSKYPDEFRKWYHNPQNSKDYKLPGQPDPNLEPIFQDWVDLGRPKAFKQTFEKGYKNMNLKKSNYNVSDPIFNKLLDRIFKLPLLIFPPGFIESEMYRGNKYFHPSDPL